MTQNLIDLFLVSFSPFRSFLFMDDTELCDGMSAVVALIRSAVQPVGFGWTPGVCPGRLPVVEAGQTSDGVNIPAAAAAAYHFSIRTDTLPLPLSCSPSSFTLQAETREKEVIPAFVFQPSSATGRHPAQPTTHFLDLSVPLSCLFAI